ncbi:MAG: 1-deoxy-D-xylulose-5-phosphate reductoisomerase [Clostridiaceae bacterium]|nr:1-deoxy-D-xylulose-5-phosphate reductoisomerase [Clostridiaceae bacterium]
MKNVMLLGSTGSIGRQTLDVVRNSDSLRIVSLAARSSVDLLEEQIREFHPKLVCVYEKKQALELQKRLGNTETEIVSGMDGLIACATMAEGDIVVASVVGMIGIRPVIEAIQAGKNIAFANKETLVTAGHIIMPLVREKKVSFLPVDSEHAAIFQCLRGEQHREVEKIILTASGGPFRGMKKEQLEKVTVEQALQHPNWSMGRKITIDSSTLVNKGLEVMEAAWLFDMPLEKIQVIVQPQSVIHSMVEFQDGAVMAQLGTPDMRMPIQYALGFPNRMMRLGEALDFTRLSALTFEMPDMETFSGLALAYEAGSVGGSMPTVYNAANEKAVALFLERKISYPEITEYIRRAMDGHSVLLNPSLEDILAVEQEVYKRIDSFF